MLWYKVLTASRPRLIVSDSTALFLGAEWSYDGLGLPSRDGGGGRETLRPVGAESLDGSIGIGTNANYMSKYLYVGTRKERWWVQKEVANSRLQLQQKEGEKSKLYCQVNEGER